MHALLCQHSCSLTATTCSILKSTPDLFRYKPTWFGTVLFTKFDGNESTNLVALIDGCPFYLKTFFTIYVILGRNTHLRCISDEQAVTIGPYVADQTRQD